MACPDSVLQLVEKFQRDIDYYRSPGYKETPVRQEFIDPLFEALGWDVGNRTGKLAAYRDVDLDYSLKTGLLQICAAAQVSV